jgi:hypothetical protein
VALKHSRFYSKIARAANGRSLSRLLLLVLDLLKQAGGVVRKTVDGQLM